MSLASARGDVLVARRSGTRTRGLAGRSDRPARDDVRAAFDSRRGSMAAANHTPSVEATVTVRVSEAATGDLVAGARAQIERIDGISVEELEIAGLQPGLNDTTVEAVATIAVDDPVRVADETPPEAGDATETDPPAPAVVADRLADGFGVDPERVERVDPHG